MKHTQEDYQNIAISLAKLIIFFEKRSNWGRHNYKNNNSFCILGAISHILSANSQRLVKPYLDTVLPVYVYSRKLTIDTGNYSLNLATFNDNVPYELMMAFIQNTYDSLIEQLDSEPNVV